MSYYISVPGSDEDWIALGNDLSLVVEQPGRCFMRVALHDALSPSSREQRRLVGELNGVRLYVLREPGSSHVSLVLTTQDLYD